MNYIFNWFDYINYRFIGCHSFIYDHVTLKQDIGIFSVGDYFQEVLVELDDMKISLYQSKDFKPIVYKINIPSISFEKI